MSSPTLTQIYEQLILSEAEQEKAAMAQQYAAQQASATSSLSALAGLAASGYTHYVYAAAGAEMPTIGSTAATSVGGTTSSTAPLMAPVVYYTPGSTFTISSPLASYIHFSGYEQLAEAADEGWWA